MALTETGLESYWGVFENESLPGIDLARRMTERTTFFAGASAAVAAMIARAKVDGTVTTGSFFRNAGQLGDEIDAFLSQVKRLHQQGKANDGVG